MPTHKSKPSDAKPSGFQLSDNPEVRTWQQAFKEQYNLHRLEMTRAEMRRKALVEELKQTKKELAASRRNEIIDPTGVTKLYNRKFGDLEQKRIHRTGSYGVLLLDLDRFKAVNDTFGHPAGDEVLRQSSEVIRKTMRRKSDVICRFGGEEFRVILPNLTDPVALATRAEELRRAIEAHSIKIDENGTSLKMTASIGAAIFRKLPGTRDKERPAAVTKRADLAVYAAKDAGRNAVCLYDNDKMLRFENGQLTEIGAPAPQEPKIKNVAQTQSSPHAHP